jgi:uncharacterized protein YjbI with pentapeptide repeats
MDLLLVPAVLAIIGVSLGLVQTGRQAAVEAQRAQDTALQSYFDEMGGLVLERRLSDCNDSEGVRAIAQAQTLTVLGRVEDQRKRSVLDFLYEADLINKGCPAVSLAGADLVGADLANIDLSNADLHEAFLAGADLQDANLMGAVLTKTWLGYVEDENQPAVAANLRGANLTNATLNGAIMDDADLGLPLSASGNRTNLSNASLQGASLDDVDLREAKLHNARLDNASLAGTDLRGVTGITKEELEQQAASLKGALMPDGTRHP